MFWKREEENMKQDKKKILKLYKNYDKKKFHGNIIISAKCQYCWNQKSFCLHQFYEMVMGVKSEYILKRDFREQRRKK